MLRYFRLIIVILLQLLILGCKAQNKHTIFPPESFSVIEAKLPDGRPVVGSVNTAYKNYGEKKSYPWCLQIHVALKHDSVMKNGLPLESEIDVANTLEDELINETGKVVTLHYIGHVYNDSFLDVYAYIDHPEKANEYLQKKTKAPDVKREFSFEIKQDKEWVEVKPFLE
ncbi:DUF695 domain-containing protein [Mucilaginibacter sp. P25]|uniref:DUF695 domain-containing protein n=1 Tax=Mucilaginibacter gossypii TaxID=551996 RepID=A0A1G8KFB7_9SPHI|nr:MULTISPECIES: DUF695 domain-containing protein [Mucilaginibacter]QTE35666.1 DUF695 domain-containing protein [Mucilaginibacter gossypii]RAV50002.1 DUF695 domain-containing protein [Mucilaginibacter rubeus]SDI42082.1 Family of unknown function [Mucilaginibacter gossypii]